MNHYYFFGHHKCATNWIRLLFRGFCKNNDWDYEVLGGKNNLLKQDRTKNFMHMYVTAKPKHIMNMQENSRGFHLIRDPRDAMVSGYWSWKKSHQNNSQEILEVREKLNNLSLESGLMEMIDRIPLVHEIEDWKFGQYDNILETKYEALLENPIVAFREIFDFLKIDISQNKLSSLVEKHSFKKITNRLPGQENVDSHFRKGISGDWKNYFTDEIKDKFKSQYGDLLIELGYEENLNW